MKNIILTLLLVFLTTPFAENEKFNSNISKSYSVNSIGPLPKFTSNVIHHPIKKTIRKKYKFTSCLASWYDEDSLTATGERFRPNGLTAAHRRLKFGTKILVQSGNNTVIVRINDRGPYIHGRCLDLSRGAAKRLHMIHSGVKKIRFRIISHPS